MTANQFRRIALRLPEATEQMHMQHPDFRVRGKIFATLGYPDDTWGMVKLTPEQQAEWVKSDPAAFAKISGTWGERGATRVHLKPAKAAAVQGALLAAWRNVAPRALVEEWEGSM